MELRHHPICTVAGMALITSLAGAEVITTEANGETHSGARLIITTEPKTIAPYDPLKDLALYNVTWTSPSRNSADSMPIGNGDLGMNVWVESNGDLLLLLSKTDAWSDNWRLLKLGRVRFNMSPNPFASGQPFVQTLNIPNGEILNTAGSGSDEVSFVSGRTPTTPPFTSRRRETSRAVGRHNSSSGVIPHEP